MASIDCTDKNLSTEEIRRMTYVVRESDGAIVKRIVEIEAEEDLGCADAKLGEDALFRLSVEKLGERMYADRVVIVT